MHLLSFRSSTRIWAQLHETAVIVLDNLREGVLIADFYEPKLNPLFKDLLDHYGVTALPCRVADPDRKGKVESGVGHTQKTPLKGKRFESLEEAQTYLDNWETHWADTRIHGTTKRQVTAMFAEEKPALLPLPVEPFRYYQYGERTVHLDGCIEVEAAYYSVPPGWIGQLVGVQWDSLHVRILDPKTHQLLREHVRQQRGRHRINPEDNPKKTPQTTGATLYARPKEIMAQSEAGILSCKHDTVAGPQRMDAMRHSQRTLIDRNLRRTSTGNLVGFLAAVAVCMLSGCVSSVSPFVSGTDIAYDARLVGSWSDSEGKESAVIVRDGDGYGISYTDSDGKVARFHGVLGRLGTRQVLDVFPESLPRELYLSLLVRTHGILVLELADRQLTIRALEVEAIKKLLEERPALVGHVLVPNTFEPRGEDVVLTAPTADVRKFLTEIIDRPGVLGNPQSWRRK